MNFIKFQNVVGKFMLANFHIRILFLFLVIIFIYTTGIAITPYQKPDIRLCYMDLHPLMPSDLNDSSSLELGLEKLEDILLAKIKPTPGKSIFFHETSCPQTKSGTVYTSELGFDKALEEGLHWNKAKLNARQACAVESAALHNRNSQVFVLFASPRYMYTNRSRSSSATDDPILDAILTYDNVHLRNLNVWSYATDTPVYDWLKDGALFNSNYIIAHFADFLRLLTLWRWGGTYLDMDIVMLRSMEELPPNFAGAESNTYLTNSIMNFDSKGFGHEIAYQCLQNFQENFDGSNWGYNGPGLITRVMQSICDTQNITLMMNSERCMSFKVYPPEAFYAIPWQQWTDFFETEQTAQTMARIKDSYVSHVWNRHSIQRPIRVGTKCAYSLMAEMHCPRVYKAAGEYF